MIHEAMILAGGLATRLGELAADTPKCLQPVAGVPFIDHLLWNARRQGVRRVIVCTGRLHERVAAHLGDGAAHGVEVVYSRETVPLGTGGALGAAAHLLTGDEALVLNGDSLMDCNHLDLAMRHHASGAAVTLALRAVDDAARFGIVTLRDDGHVSAFGEKAAGGPGLINAGVYVASTAWLRSLPAGPSSLELEHFPALAAAGRLEGAAYAGFFADIGLPESLAAAQDTVAAWRHKPCAFLDRDGVINVDTDYVHTSDEFVWMLGMPGAIKLLNDAGWLVVVITNQAGIGRGHYTEEQFQDFTAWIDERLAEAGAHVEATYRCPHHPTAAQGEYLRVCDCRKPAPGMLLQAIAEWEPDVERSFMLGDTDTDMGAAAAAGVRGVRYTGGDLTDIVAGLIG